MEIDAYELQDVLNTVFKKGQHVRNFLSLFHFSNNKFIVLFTILKSLLFISIMYQKYCSILLKLFYY